MLIFYDRFSNLINGEKIHVNLQKGYDDIDAGRVQDAVSAFAKFRESH